MIIICAICLDSMSDDAISAKCGHVYHKCCLDRWLNSSGNSCPDCRKSIIRGELNRLYLTTTTTTPSNEGIAPINTNESPSVSTPSASAPLSRTRSRSPLNLPLVNSQNLQHGRRNISSNGSSFIPVQQTDSEHSDYSRTSTEYSSSFEMDHQYDYDSDSNSSFDLENSSPVRTMDNRHSSSSLDLGNSSPVRRSRSISLDNRPSSSSLNSENSSPVRRSRSRSLDNRHSSSSLNSENNSPVRRSRSRSLDNRHSSSRLQLRSLPRSASQSGYSMSEEGYSDYSQNYLESSGSTNDGYYNPRSSSPYYSCSSTSSL